MQSRAPGAGRRSPARWAGPGAGHRGASERSPLAERLIARIDREPSPSRTSVLEVEIERVFNELASESGRDSRDEPERQRLLARCERLRGVLLERRVRREIGWSTAGMPPERLLAADPSFTISGTSRLARARRQRRCSSALGGRRPAPVGRIAFVPADRTGRTCVRAASGDGPCRLAPALRSSRPDGPGRDQRDGRVHRGHVPAVCRRLA